MYVYLDADGVVLGCSTTERTLEQAQAMLPDVASVIGDAPHAVVCLNMHRPAGLPAHYHQHTSGDGTDISDYTEIAFLGQYRCERSKAIDARTVELIAAGFAFDDGLGGGVRVFSLSLAAQSKITNAYVLRNEGGFTYPVTWNSIDDSAVVTLADAAAVAAFHGTAAVTARTHEESGTVLKGQIRAATTVAAVDAVVDTR